MKIQDFSIRFTRTFVSIILLHFKYFRDNRREAEEATKTEMDNWRAVPGGDITV